MSSQFEEIILRFQESGAGERPESLYRPVVSSGEQNPLAGELETFTYEKFDILKYRETAAGSWLSAYILHTRFTSHFIAGK